MMFVSWKLPTYFSSVAAYTVA